MKNLFAFVTFGGLEFTKLAVNSIRDTVKSDYEMFSIVGKPGDTDTANWLSSQGIANKVHNQNYGFPASINDIYDYAWKENNFDNLIILGNDVVLYPYAGDSLIALANISDYEVVSGLQYDVKDLANEFPEARKFFSGEDYIFSDFSSKPWELFTGYSEVLSVEHMRLFDIQNMCLYKKSVFDKIGYTDVNFYPAYFIDNDYARRIVQAGIKCCSLSNARFFHFWSRVIKQGSGGSTNRNFENNRDYYKSKWGGFVGEETSTPSLGIFDRSKEFETISYWRNK